MRLKTKTQNKWIIINKKSTDYIKINKNKGKKIKGKSKREKVVSTKKLMKKKSIQQKLKKDILTEVEIEVCINKYKNYLIFNDFKEINEGDDNKYENKNIHTLESKFKW